MAAAPVAADAVPPALRNAVLAWYEAGGRSLAFRVTRDPYAVLVSELMAQQTQAARAAEAWTAWMARFPTVEALAAAPTSEVLRSWAGLGYNRRAISLQRAARAIVDEHAGRVPERVEALVALPGVGPYTARAVLAIAFGLPVGPVDTNVRRVLGRIVAGDPAAIPPAALQSLADAVVPVGRAGDWTHALMDLGAGPCRPRRPRCDGCPAAPWCRYLAGVAGSEAVDPPSSPPRRGRALPFPSTTRWLRGRILARARDMPDGDWAAYGEPIGVHDRAAVRDALAALVSDGLLEHRDVAGVPEGRLPR